jgi:hypothetical protein
VINQGSAVEISGEMSFGTADSLQAILDQTPSVKTLRLNTTGGWISEGQRLARLVEQHQLATYTTTECDSACLLVFLAGNPRWLGPGARLGFHQASVAGVSGEVAEKGNQLFRDAMMYRGAPTQFIDHALSIPPSDIWYPTQRELEQAHLVTERPD